MEDKRNREEFREKLFSIFDEWDVKLWRGIGADERIELYDEIMRIFDEILEDKKKRVKITKIINEPPLIPMILDMPVLEAAIQDGKTWSEYEKRNRNDA